MRTCLDLNIWIEEYCFEASVIPYAKPRTREQVQELLLADMNKYGQFILSAVNGDFGDDINAMYDCVIYMKAALNIRLHRIKQRSIDKFGKRVLEGGDMYEKEQKFFDFVASRTMDKTDIWLKSLRCPVIIVDGTEPALINARMLKESIMELMNS